jgi:hypothetical protein
MDIIESPQDNISSYLYNAINIEIYEEYETCKYEGRKESFDFFNFLYREFAFFNENIENYLIIKSHFKDYDNNTDYDKIKNDEILSLNMTHYYEALVKIIKEKHPLKLREGVILKSCEYIESISDVLTSMIYGTIDQMNDILKENESLNYGEKIENLLQNKYLSLRNEALFVDKKGITIASKIDIEIEKLKKLNKIKKTETIESIETELKTLNWQGSELQFSELTKALIQSNLISPELHENERFRRMKRFFNMNDFDEGDKLKDIRKRTNTTTPLLNTLETSLNNWIKKKD